MWVCFFFGLLCARKYCCIGCPLCRLSERLCVVLEGDVVAWLLFRYSFCICLFMLGRAPRQEAGTGGIAVDGIMRRP